MATPENDKQTAKISAASVSTSFLNHLTHTVGRPLEFSTPHEQYRALAHTVRDLVMENWITTVQGYKKPDLRVVTYMSAEYLLGPHLLNDLQALGITKDCDEAMRGLGLDLSALAAQEPEPGLGNGGLGRLAACFMDSLSTLNVPAIGYGLRYEFGIRPRHPGWLAGRTSRHMAAIWKPLGDLCFGCIIRSEVRWENRDLDG
jgi:starch phosphorylase